MITKKNPPHLFYSSMDNNDDQLFSDEQIQRYDADTIKHRYGDNWRNYASNVREIKQADGSIVRGKYVFFFILLVNYLFFVYLEYIIEDPSLLKEIKPSVDSTSSTTGSDDEQQSSKHKFAQIKAKFEQKSFTNVMASPTSSSSVASSHTTTRRNSNQQIDDLNTRNRRESNDSLSMNRPNTNVPIAPSISTNSQHSRTVIDSSFQRLHSADEADEEVRRIHRQGVELRHHQQGGRLTPISSIDETQQQRNVQYEVVDEDGNPMVINDVHDLIKMSGVTAREVPQPDGTIVREYVIDDPQVLSKFHSQQFQQENSYEHIPPPPPRIPLKQSALFRQEPLNNDYHPPPINIQQVRTLEPQRRYEFQTTSGKRIEFLITNLGSDETDIHELANAINTRILPSSSNTTQQKPFTLPKQWHPAVDLTHREPQIRQRTGSDNQPIPNNYNIGFQQIPPSIQTDLNHSVPYQQQFAPVFAEPIIDWSAVQQQDPHGQIDPQFIRQYITQKHQNGSFQTSAQFLPEQQQQQMTRSTISPSRNNPPVFYQQTMPYPYQGQQQHGVTILPPNTNDFNFNQQQIVNGHTRI